jgi:hypothetical protein
VLELTSCPCIVDEKDVKVEILEIEFLIIVSWLLKEDTVDITTVFV